MTLRFTGAKALIDGQWQEADIGIADGRLTLGMAAERTVDLSGYLILPGMIDLHGDGFERHLAPRRGAISDLSAGLATTESELAANGITTAYLAQFYSWEGGMRGPDFAKRFFAALDTYTSLGTDMRAQLRFETHMIDEFDTIAELVAQHRIDYTVFNDHLPHDALAAGKKPPRLTGQALKGGRNPDDHLKLLQSLHDNGPRAMEMIGNLAKQLTLLGTRLGSHDDATPETRNFWSDRGVTICEFPETTAAARAAKNAGDPVIMGAPNVLRGASHKGNVSATDLIQAGLCDALASDYHYPALRQAIQKLAQNDPAQIARFWPLVSQNPARIMGLNDRGVIADDMRADLIITDSNFTHAATIANGKFTHAAGPIVDRLIFCR